MGLVKKDDGWRMPDELWAKLEPLLPPRPEHPLGYHNPRVPDRQAMDAILLVLRASMQWGALRAAGICHPSSAYRRFREWLAAGADGLRRTGGHQLELVGIGRGDGQCAAGWGKTGPNPTDRGKTGTKKSLLTDSRGAPSASWLVAPTRTASSWRVPHSSPFQSPGLRPLKPRVSTSGRTWGTTTTRCDGSPRNSASRCTCRDVGRGNARRSAMLESRRGGGWWSAATPGSIASVDCWSVGRSARIPTWGCCT